MYDTDEEIRRKRRNLFIIIGIIVLLILLLIIFLVVRNSGKSSKSNEETQNEIGCTLEVKGGVTPDANGVYHQAVEVGFKSIDAISEKYPISKHTIGTVDNSRNKETFNATKAGTYHLYGFVQDEAGHKGKCEIKFELSLSVPTCELEIINGTLGDNNWYRSDVEVGFKSMESNNQSVSISKYYITKELKNLDNSQIVEQDTPSENSDKYVVKDNLSTTLIGHVIDSAGNEGTCSITVNKDSSVPTCSLKVNSGSKNGNGEYTDNPEIGIAETKDDVSGVASQGIGISKNYSQTTFKVTDEGKTTVVGYVKDKAGNEGTCSLEITRPTSSGQSQGGGGQQTKDSSPNCTIKLSGDISSGVYTSDVTATLEYSTTNGATITGYGIAESESYNGKNKIVISKDDSHVLHGIVKDSYGHSAKCVSSSFVIKHGVLLSTKVQAGDYVNYDAGTWNETRSSEERQDGYYWGMTSGTSKGQGVKCNKNDTGTKNGWRVLAVDNGKVVLVSAGTTECIYHAKVDPNYVAGPNGVMVQEASKYVNSKYAYGYTVLSCNTPGFTCASSYAGEVYVTTNHYWISQSGEGNGIMVVSPSGLKTGSSVASQGLRPVIILKADVMTTGSKDSNGAWILI